MNKIIYVIVLILLGGCSSYSETEKFQNKRDVIVDVAKDIKELDTGDILIGSVSRLYMSDKYLLIVDHKSIEKQVHIFNKDNFDYVNSIADFGEGPNEITMIGCLGLDNKQHKVYISDHGKQKIFSYHLDSIQVSSYKPQIKTVMNQCLFPADYQYINDTMSIAVIIKPTGVSTFDQTLGKWNMDTGEIEPMKYVHPDIKEKRSCFVASEEKGIYVEGYTHYDLMTICSFSGELLFNIYGPKWGSRGRLHCFRKMMMGKNRIFALYSGEDYSKAYYPTKFLVFDLEGNYLKTLETGYKIADCCYDSSNDRIIMTFNDDIQFGYLELKNII